MGSGKWRAKTSVVMVMDQGERWGAVRTGAAAQRVKTARGGSEGRSEEGKESGMGSASSSTAYRLHTSLRAPCNRTPA